MLAVFQTSLLYALFVITVFAVIRWRRRRANVAPVPHFKPTPWDEFRRRVVQATGCQTVHEALKQGHVTQLPGGWLEFDELAHHADESATVADLWQARADHAALVEPEPESPWVGRRVWGCFGHDYGVVRRVHANGCYLVCDNGLINPGWAELHWDDVRAGDVQTADAFHADGVWREVLAVDGRLIDVCTASGSRFTLVARPSDKFLPAGVA